MRHKRNGQFGFFDLEQQLAKIYELDDFLPKLNSLIDWELFRPILSKVRKDKDPANGGRPPFDEVLMFKILVLKSTYNLADRKTEKYIRDSISARVFLGLTHLADPVPDEKTIWLFAEQLKNLGLERELFDRFNKMLDASGFAVKSGLIVDGTFVEVPRQHNSKEENEQIKNGEVPERLAANPHVLAQKDLDARWTKKNAISYFGYKDHALVDDAYKFVRDYDTTDASVHDIKPYPALMPEKPEYPDQEAFGDSAYMSKENVAELTKRGFLPMIHEKGYRNKPLTEEQKAMNKIRSSVRCRVEHVFGSMKMRMGKVFLLFSEQPKRAGDVSPVAVSEPHLM